MNEPVDRVVGWLREVAAESSERVVTIAGGAVFLHADLPDAHSHNRVVLWSPVDGEVAAASAEAVMAGAGLRHRKVDVVVPEVADQVEAGLTAAGYERSHELVLTYDGRTPPDSAAAVVTLGLDHRVRAAIESWQVEQPDWDAAVVRQLGERIRAITPVVEPTFLAVVEGDAVLARVDLYVRDGVAQIEELVTEPAGQKRGYATALMGEALRRAEAAGAEVVFLIADADDWPVTWYRRIGFNDLMSLTSYSR